MRRTATLLILAALASCGDEPDAPAGAAAGTTPGADAPLPPTARPEIVEQFREDREATRAPSDGRGTVTLRVEKARGPGPEGSATDELVAGGAARFHFEYTAGEAGIAVGGALLFLAPPFWEWSHPQAHDPRGPGYCVVGTTADDVMLSAEQVDRGLLAITVGGRAIEAGERIRLIYGAGAALARVDCYAEREMPLWFRVDGDGDGIGELIADPPRVDVVAGPARDVVVTLASTATPGGDAALDLALIDVFGNRARGPAQVALTSSPAGLAVPDVVAIDDDGATRVVLQGVPAGTWRVDATARLGEVSVAARSNPLWSRDDVTPIRWADLHGHSGVSDGTGTPEDWFAYAREVAGLDVAALTDHDHWGVQPLDTDAETWERIGRAVEAANDPGRFVALHAYEWTNWIHGHRHVMYFGADGELLSAMDEATDTPTELWDALRGHPAMTFAHHSAGGPIATNWDYAPDPELEPLTEVMSVHGSSEAADSPRRIYAPLSGNFVRDQLARGYRLGFVGSGDGHDGHPGLSHRDPKGGWRRSPAGRVRVGNGGAAAVRTAELTREGVLAALRARAAYATSGPRILLDATVRGASNPATISAADLADDTTYELEISGTAPLSRVVFVVGRAVDDDAPLRIERDTLELDGDTDLRTDTRVGRLPAGSFVYARIEQEDGALAWSCPVFVDP